MAFRIPFVFVGNETLATGVSSEGILLSNLISNGWVPEAIILAQHRTTKKPFAVETLARAHSIPVEHLQDKGELPRVIDKYRPTFAVLAAFGMIVSKEVLDMFAGGIVNLHPSLLPRHRGSSPIEQSILDGDTQTGITLMKLNEGMDSGPLYDQRPLDTDPRKLTKQELHDALVELGSAALLDHIDSIANLTANTQPQTSKNLSSTSKIAKRDGVLDWSEKADVIGRKIRAYQGWPTAQSTINGVQASIHEAQQTNKPAGSTPGHVTVENKELYIDCADRQLKITRLQPAGKKIMNAADFINGYLS